MKSFRVQVVLWITVVVALALIGLGSAISGLTLSRMSQSIDDELVSRAHGMSIGPGMMGGPPGVFPPGDGMPRSGGPGDGPQPPPRRVFGGEQADLIGSIRRPRFIAPDGNLLGGFRGDTAFDLAAAKRALRGPPVFSETVFQSAPVRVYSLSQRMPSFPMNNPGGAGAVDDGASVVQVARELTDFNEVKRIQTDMLSIFLPLGLVGAVAVAWFLTGRVMRPIKEMESAAEAIGAGQLSQRLKVSGNDEFAQLGTQFNQMADNVQGSILRLEEALEQQRRFTADASHELRTPLTRMLLATSSVTEGSQEDRRSAMSTVVDAAHDMSKLVQQLLDLANLETGSAAQTFAPVDFRLVVSETVLKLPGGGANFDVDLPSTIVTVSGNADLLERACLNILENARRYSPAGQTVIVSLLAADGRARLTVQDRGEGIAQEHIPHLTERFFRVDSARSREIGGSGLGLAIVDEIVMLHRGNVTFTSVKGDGLAVVIDLPLA